MSATVQTGLARFATLIILQNVHGRSVPWRSYSYILDLLDDNVLGSLDHLLAHDVRPNTAESVSQSGKQII